MDLEGEKTRRRASRTALLIFGIIFSMLGIGVSVATWNPLAILGTIIVGYLTIRYGRGTFTDTDFED